MAESKTVRVRNKTTGVVVSVREEKVGRLGGQWESAGTRSTSKSTSSK